MGCKLSVERGVAKHEASVAAARDTWKRRVRGAADQWTAHSTLAAAKHASAQGMPEPPAQFFAAQQRLDDFFHAHGERLVCAPGELILEEGAEVDALYLIEEGSVSLQKDVRVERPPPFILLYISPF